MADEPSESSYYGLGLSNTPVTPEPPTRSGLGYLRDVALDTTRGALGIVRDVGGLREMGAVSPEQRQQARSDMDELGKIDYWLQRGKTEAGRYRAEHPAAKTLTDEVTDVATGILPYAPLAAAGPAAPAVFGGLALGHQRVAIRDQLRDTPDEHIAEAANRAGIDQTGKTPDQVRDELYGVATDPTKLDTWLNAAPAVVGNVLGAGALGLMTKGAMRTLSGTITDRVMSNISQGTGAGAFIGRRLTGGAAGAVGGAAMGAGGVYTQQATEQAAGLRPQGVDWGDVAREGGTQGAIFGAIGAVTHGRQPAPPIGTDTVTVARMQEAGYGEPGRVMPRVTGGQPMEAGDIMETGGEYGSTWGQPAPPPAPGRPMVAGDIQPAGEYGPEQAAMPPPPTRGMRPMQPADVAYPQAGAPREMTPYDVGIAPMPQRGPYQPPDRGPPMPEAEVSPGVAQQRAEYGVEGPTETARGGAREMGYRDIYPSEYGPEGLRVAGRTIRGRPMETGDIQETGEFGPATLRPAARAALARGRRQMREADIVPTSEYGPETLREPGPPVEPGRPMEIRDIADWRPEEGPTGPAPRQPPRGGGGEGGAGGPPRGGAPPPRGGAPAGGVAAARRRAELQTLEAFSAEPVRNLIARVMDKGTRTDHRQWLRALESGAKYSWAKMPRSWKDAVKGMEKDVHDVVNENPRAVIDQLRSGREPVYEHREAVPEDIGTHVPIPEGERRGPEEAEGKADYEEWQEGRSRFEPSEYGPEIAPGEEFGRRPYRPQRARVGESIGLTRRGEFTPDTRLRMQRQAGIPLSPADRAAAIRAGMGRLAPAPALQRVFARLQKGPERGLYPPEMPSTRGSVARQERFYGARRAEQIRAEERARTEARTVAARRREYEDASGIVKDVMGDIEAADVFFHDLGQHVQQLAERAPGMEATAKVEAARAREAARKRGRTKADYAARERTLRSVLLDRNMSIDRIPADFLRTAEGETTGRQLTMRNWLDEVVGPAGLVNLRPAEEMTAGLPHEVALDSAQRGDLVAAARRMADLMSFHVEAGDAALRKLYAELYPPDARRQAQISFRIGTHKSGLYPWYDTLGDFKRRAAQLAAAARQVRGRGGMNAVATLRNQMLEGYMRLRLLSEGKIERLKELNQQTESVLFEDMQADILKQRGAIDDYNRANDTLQNMYRQATEAGENTKRGAQIMADARRLADRLQKMTSPELAQRRLDQIYMAQRAMEEMHTAAGRSVAAFANAVHEWIDSPQIQHNQRRVLAQFYRDIFGTADRLPHDEQVQLSRERAQGSAAAYEQSLRDARSREQIEGSRQEVARQEEAQPRRTRAESEALIRANEDRASELLYARGLIPDDIPAGQVRGMIDTLRYYLQTPQDPMRMTQPQKTRAMLDQLTQRIDNEIARLQDDTRREWETIEPNGKQWDYTIGRVLDPAADLFGTRQRPTSLEERALGRARRPEPPGLPRGAAAYHVSDFFEGPRDIRPTGNTPREKLLNHFFGIVNKVAGDAEVVALTPEQYQNVRQARGIADGDHPAFYDQQTHRIFTTKDVINGPDRARILGHEFMHPLTVAAAERFPEVAGRLDAIRQEVLKAYMEPSGRIVGGEFRPNDVKDILKGKTQGITGSVHEFISELFNDDGSLFSALASMPTRPEFRVQIRTEARQNFLGRALEVIRSGITKLFMQTNKNKLLNDAVIHSLDLFQQMEEAAQGRRVRPTAKAEVHPFTIEDSKEFAKQGIERARYSWEQRGGVSGHFLRWHDLNQLGRRAEPGFRDVVAPFERIVNQVYSTTRDIIEKSGTPEMLQRLATMSRLPAERWREFTDYINDENYAGLSGADPLIQRDSAGERTGENRWVSEDAGGHAQMRRQHTDLERRWAALSPEMKAMRNELLDFSRRRHREMLDANLNRMIDAKGLAEGDPAKAAAIRKHILEEPLSSYEEGKLAEAQQTRGFDDWVDAVRGIDAFRKLPGVWYPMFRRGQWVTEGMFNLAKHANNGQEINRGEWQFETAAERDAFLKRMENDPTMQGVKLLRVRDVGYEKDPETGGLKLADGKPKRIRRSEDAAIRYRAEFNPLLLEFHDSKFNAAQRHAEIKQRYGDAIDMTHVEPVRDRNSTYLPETKATAAMEAMKRSLQGSEGWQNMSDVERAQFTRDMDDAAIRHLMSSTARATYLPRRYALGADKDLIKNFLQYGNNTARTLSETMHHEEIRSQVQKLDKYVEDNKRAGSPGDPEGRYGTLRRQIQNQIHSVLAEHPDPNMSPMWKKGLARVLQLSYIDRLVSPSFLLLNASEPWVLGLPLLAGHHGALKAAREIGRAYNTVGALRLMAKGGKDFKDVVKSAITGEDLPLSDNLQLLREAIKNEPDAAQLNKLFDYANEHGYFDRNAGMELEQMFNPDASRVGRIADYTDNAFRQVNNQVENINRAVTAIASYRLGLQKGMSHEQAMAHAKDMMHDVNGNYAAHASPAVFRSQWLKPALQFKRYAHRITSNYLRIMATSFGRNVKPEDRAVALKQLGYWTAAQVAVSGVLGLPTEPLKAVVNGLHLVGAINWNWDDVEYQARDAAADWLGPELGMALTRGALRNAGLGIGTRLGHDSLWTYGNIENWQDLPGAIGKLVTGSPGGFAVDTATGITAGVRGLNNWAQGFDSQADNDFGEFVQKAIPIKAVGDVYRTYSQLVGGRMGTTKGGQPMGYVPTPVEAALSAVGVRSAREQEASDLRHEFMTKQKRYNDQKNQLLTAYAVADTPAEKMRVMRHVTQDINPTLAPELKISVKQLVDADVRRRQRGTQPTEMMGLPVNKRTRALLPRPDVYNVGQ